jgi:hypothetical protein
MYDAEAKPAAKFVPMSVHASFMLERSLAGQKQQVANIGVIYNTKHQ